MDHHQLQNYLPSIGDDALDFSTGVPLWEWQMDCPMERDVLDAIPLMQSYPLDPFFPPQDLLAYELHSTFDGEIGFWDDATDASETKRVGSSTGGESGEESKEKRAERCREEKALTFEEVSRYFYMPITQAAKELQVGLTLLKKRCRELGIPRWPHRKMKSLQTLINNVHELVRGEGEAGEAQARSAVELLERERSLLEKEPGVQLEEKTKRLRQACFKANYKKRRLMQALEAPQSPPSPSSYLCQEDNEDIH